MDGRFMARFGWFFHPVADPPARPEARKAWQTAGVRAVEAVGHQRAQRWRIAAQCIAQAAAQAKIRWPSGICTSSAPVWPAYLPRPGMAHHQAFRIVRRT